MQSENISGVSLKRPARLFKDKKRYMFYVWDSGKKKYVKVKIPSAYQSSDAEAQQYVASKMLIPISEINPESNVGKKRPGLDTTDISDYKTEDDVDLKFIGNDEEKEVLKKRVKKRNKETDDKKKALDLAQEQVDELKKNNQALVIYNGAITSGMTNTAAGVPLPGTPVNTPPGTPVVPPLVLPPAVSSPINNDDVLDEAKIVEVPLSPKSQAAENKRIAEGVAQTRTQNKINALQKELDQLYKEKTIPGTKLQKTILRGRPNKSQYETEEKGKDQYLKYKNDAMIMGRKFGDMSNKEKEDAVKRLNNQNMTWDKLIKINRRIEEIKKVADGVGAKLDFKNKVGKGEEESKPGKLPALWSDEINQFFANEPLFGGVVASDQLLDFADWRPPFGIVMNKDKSDQPGSHWIAMNFTPDSIEYFDPLGDEPDKHVITQIKKLVYDKWKWPVLMKFKTNEIVQQHGNSQTCGYHAIRFLVDRFQGMPWMWTTRFNNSKEGEQEIKSRFKYI